MRVEVLDGGASATLVAGGQGSHHRGDAGAWRQGVRGCAASRDFGEPGVHLAPAIASEPCPAAVVSRVAAVRISEAPTETAVSTASEPPRGAGGRSGVIEISLGGGRRVWVDASVDAAALARVLDVLERR